MSKKKNDNIESTKSLVDGGFTEVESVVVTPVETKFPNVKRMLVSLDKFLNRRIAVIGIIYIMALIAGGAGLIANGETAFASDGSGNGAMPIVNVWIYSLLGVATFLFLLILVRVVSVRLATNKK